MRRSMYRHPSEGGGKSGGRSFMGKTGGQSGTSSTILCDPCPRTHDAALTKIAIDKSNRFTSQERVTATQGVVDPVNLRKILKSKHEDSKELARYKLKGLGYNDV